MTEPAKPSFLPTRRITGKASPVEVAGKHAAMDAHAAQDAPLAYPSDAAERGALKEQSGPPADVVAKHRPGDDVEVGEPAAKKPRGMKSGAMTMARQKPLVEPAPVSDASPAVATAAASV